jgi:methyl-accepting chemotaxis protein
MNIHATGIITLKYNYGIGEKVMNINDYKIGTRLSLAFGIVLLLMTAISAVAIYSLWQMNKNFSNISENSRNIEFANDVRNEIQKVNGAAMTVALVNDEKTRTAQKKILEDSTKNYQTSLVMLEKSTQSKEMKDLIAKLKTAIEGVAKDNNKVIQLAQSDLQELAMSTYMGNMLTTNTILGMCDRIVEAHAKQSGLLKTNSENTYARVRNILAGISVLIIFLSTIIAGLLKRSVVRPLQKAVQAANMLAAGDLTANLEITGKDEMSSLLGAMQNTSVILREMVRNIKNSADNLASASMQLSAGSEEMSRNAIEESNRASQVAIASEEMTQTVMDMAKNAASIAVSSTDTSEAAKKGGEMVNRTVKDIDAIAATAAESSRIIQTLGDRSKEIGNIIGVISDIADQTNLLALNAAIEAARAGEHGRGFAVVADEVRKLAEQTTTATKEIEQTIGSIRTEVEKAISAMDNTASKVKSGVALANESGTALGHIVTGVTGLQGMIQQIASATEEMSATTDEIAKDIGHIANSAKENSSAAEQTTQSSVEMSNLAVNLQQIVGRFIV